MNNFWCFTFLLAVLVIISVTAKSGVQKKDVSNYSTTQSVSSEIETSSEEESPSTIFSSPDSSSIESFEARQDFERNQHIIDVSLPTIPPYLNNTPNDGSLTSEENKAINDKITADRMFEGSDPITQDAITRIFGNSTNLYNTIFNRGKEISTTKTSTVILEKLSDEDIEKMYKSDERMNSTNIPFRQVN